MDRVYYARSPGNGLAAGDRRYRMWHKIRTDGTVHGYPTGDGWDLADRLPPRLEPHCRFCFPDHHPGTADYRTGRIDDWAQRAIDTVLKGTR